MGKAIGVWCRDSCDVIESIDLWRYIICHVVGAVDYLHEENAVNLFVH